MIIATMILPVFISCDSNSGKNIPTLLVSSEDISVAEDVPGGIVEIPLYFSIVPEEEGSFDYYTVDSTAIGGEDYVVRTKETITLKPGQTSVVLRLELIPNPGKIYDVAFNVKFENQKNCIIPFSRLRVKILNVDYQTLVWSDEFNYASLNTNIWNFETGAGGWGNNELQRYTDAVENVHLDSGYLHITALNPSAGTYTSGRITTMGKKEFKNCRVELRAQLPEGKGLWPALWMLGANFSAVGWPACGEIDIMEYLGHTPSTSYGAIHWNNNGHTYVTGTYNLPSGKFSSEFHIFSLTWTPSVIKWYVDGNMFFSKNRSELSGFPIEMPQFFIVNLAVGGNWPGNPDGTTVFPQHLIVDYIRVFQ